MLTIELTPHDLSNVRFAFSPLWELAASKWALMNPSLFAVHLQWINEANLALEDTSMPYFSSLITVEGHFANFLVPRPQTPRPTFAAELQRLRQTTSEQIAADLDQLDATDPAIKHFGSDPTAALTELCAELERYWQLTLAHHWPRIQAVLESDVIYRARQLAIEGPEVLFNDLHHAVHYADNQLKIETRHEGHLKPDGDGLMLIPLVFMWNDFTVPETDAYPTISYGVRGGGLWRQTVEEQGTALAAAMGAGRAQVLQQLETPRNTGELAERLGVTAGNISSHIARLREAGLVESQQTGKWVFHRLTQRGEQLMALFGDDRL